VAVIDYVASLNEIRFQGMIRIPSAMYRNFEHSVMIFFIISRNVAICLKTFSNSIDSHC